MRYNVLLLLLCIAPAVAMQLDQHASDSAVSDIVKKLYYEIDIEKSENLKKLPSENTLRQQLEHANQNFFQYIADLEKKKNSELFWFSPCSYKVKLKVENRIKYGTKQWVQLQLLLKYYCNNERQKPYNDHLPFSFKTVKECFHQMLYIEHIVRTEQEMIDIINEQMKEETKETT